MLSFASKLLHIPRLELPEQALIRIERDIVYAPRDQLFRTRGVLAHLADRLPGRSVSAIGVRRPSMIKTPERMGRPTRGGGQPEGVRPR